MFRGATKVTIDDKGRVVVPTQHRDELAAPAAGQVIVTAGRSQCLLVYTLTEWDVVQTKINSLPSLDPLADILQHLVIGHATDLVLDSHGRLALTSELRDYAGLDRAAWIVGVGRRLEIWDDGRWKAKREEWVRKAQDITQLSAALSELQI